MVETGCLQRKGDKYGGKGMTYCISATQGQSKKVTNMVGTFLNREAVIVPYTKKERKKVTNTEGTFLNSAPVRVSSTKMEQKKVTIMVGTFLNADVDIPAQNPQPERWLNKRGLTQYREMKTSSFIKFRLK